MPRAAKANPNAAPKPTANASRRPGGVPDPILVAARKPTSAPISIPKPKGYVFGRPTIYRPEFCQAVVEDAAKGYSLTATCALLGCAKSQMTEWQQVYPDFQAAVARAKVIRSRSFEGHLVDMSANGGDNTRFQAVKLGLINASPDEFKEKVAETTVNITLAALIQESMKHREIVDGTPVADD